MSEGKKYTLKELKKKLTQKQKIFCHEYIIDWNATRSAKVAGYSEKTAYQIGFENLTKLEIQQYIDFIKEDLEKEAGISKLKILLEHKKIAFSSIAHLHETWIDRKEFDQLSDEQKACILEISTQIKTTRNVDGNLTENEYVKIKLYDKQKSLDSISKMLGFNEPDKIDLSNKDGSLKLKIGDQEFEV